MTVGISAILCGLRRGRLNSEDFPELIEWIEDRAETILAEADADSVERREFIKDYMIARAAISVDTETSIASDREMAIRAWRILNDTNF